MSIRRQYAGVSEQLRRVCLVACVMLFWAPSGAWAGGDEFGPDDHGPDAGPAFFGFVKDLRGSPVRDAKVSATHKNLTFVTRSTATGAYRLRGFKNDINPGDVVIACSKEGYKQSRTFRRPLAKGKPVKSVETECRLAPA